RSRSSKPAARSADGARSNPPWCAPALQGTPITVNARVMLRILPPTALGNNRPGSAWKPRAIGRQASSAAGACPHDGDLPHRRTWTPGALIRENASGDGRRAADGGRGPLLMYVIEEYAPITGTPTCGWPASGS